MKTYDLVIVLIVAFLLVRNLIATSLNAQVKVKGNVSGQFIANIILSFIVCLLVVIKLSEFSYPWIPPVGMAVFVLSGFLVKSGIADGGLCYNGRRISFNEMEFYAIEAVTEKNFRLRVHGFNKEYILAFPIDKRGEVEACMKGGKVKFAERMSPGERKDEQQ